MPNQDSRSEKLNPTKLFAEIRMWNKGIADIKETLKELFCFTSTGSSMSMSSSISISMSMTISNLIKLLLIFNETSIKVLSKFSTFLSKHYENSIESLWKLYG